MAWQLRHEGSPRVLSGLGLPEIVEGLRDGNWDVSDEILGPDESAWQAIENHPQFAEIVEDLLAPPPRRHEEPTSLDLNAMIDVCLVLLIFFILTTSYVNLVQKVVPLPTAKADSKVKVVRSEDVKRTMVRVQAYLNVSGQPIVLVENQTVDVLGSDGRSIDPEKVKQALASYTQGEDRKTEILLDAKDITWENVISIQDGARSAGIQSVRHLFK